MSPQLLVLVDLLHRKVLQSTLLDKERKSVSRPTVSRAQPKIKGAISVYKGASLDGSACAGAMHYKVVALGFRPQPEAIRILLGGGMDGVQ